MNETENNTSGTSTEAKTPHVLDFNGVEIHPDLYAVKADELQRIGNAAYQAGRSERDAEHEAERSKLLARIAEVEKQRDESREAHAKTELRLKDHRDRSNRQWATLCEIGALASQKDNETFPEAVRRVVAEKASAVETLRDCRAKLEEEREARREMNFHVRTITRSNHDEATLDAVKRVVAERDDAAWREAHRANQRRAGDVFDPSGLKLGEVICKMPNSTFSVGMW